MSWPEVFFVLITMFIFSFYLLLYGFYSFLLVSSIYAAWKQPRLARFLLSQQMMESITTPPVTLLVPAYNEEATIVESVQALLGLHYPRLGVLVINDGSRDETLDELIRSFALRRADVVYNPILPTERIRGIYLSTVEPRLMVIDKVGGGKSDALNAGLNLSRTPWVCSVDADSLLEEDALLRAMRPAIEDETVVATSGIVRIANGCRVAAGRVLRVALPSERLVTLQVVEYLHAFLQGRMGWSWINGLLVISGAFGLFRTDVLRAVGGYSRETVGEDMEVVARIQLHCRQGGGANRLVFVPDPICWTEVPTHASGLRRQRRRWQRGLAEVLTMHKHLFFRPRLGVVGFLALPYFALELVAPMVEIFGFLWVPLAWTFGWLSSYYLVLYVILAFLLGILFSLWAVVLEEFTYRRYTSWRDLVRLLLYSLVEHLGYHQLLLWWRLEGIYDYLRGRRAWGEQVRTGFRRPVPSKP